ncbi:Dual serine/threonine and tyrosine protein kinase [Armadillidium vulgare]|nr:Dual serine/threonine and tyrosine protein kinase [Armadillidium vulgare]
MEGIATTQREFNSFFTHVKHLRNLQKETLEAIENVGKSGKLSQEQLDDLRFDSEELEDLRRALYVPTCIVIAGQSFHGKLALATRLLGEQILPIVNIPKKSESHSYRPLRLQFSSQENSFAIFDSVSKHCSDVPNKVLSSLSVEDVEFKDEELQGKNSDEVIQGYLNHTLLKDSLQIVLTPSFSKRLSKSFCIKKSSEFLRTVFSSVFPIILYAITKISFTDEVPSPMSKSSKSRHKRDSSLSDEQSSDDDDNGNCVVARQRKSSVYHSMPESLLYILCEKIGCLTRRVPPQKLHERFANGEPKNYNDYLEDLLGFPKVVNFFNLVLNDLLVKATTLLHGGHTRCMRMFILYAFDMAREIQITPRRINYAKEKENELFETLMDIASKKQDEIKDIILESLSEIRESILEKATNYEFRDVELPENMEELTPRDVRVCTTEIQELVLSDVNEAVGRQLSMRLDIMRESYLGTLQRCLENLENDCNECGESTNIGNALKQMMNAAYQLEVTSSTSSSSLQSFLDKMKLFVTAMPGRAPPVIDAEWKNRVAVEMISSLSESKLARNICTQFRERLKLSHEYFVVCMKQLESQLVCRLEQKEENHLRMKKCDAPKLARMSLESTSLRDMILYGMPTLGREVGRGQYGVVFGCKKWGKYKPCAIKSLEVYQNMKELLTLRGSVIDYTYGQGETPAVLLIMDRLYRDLYCGIKTGLDWLERLQIAVDVTQGIRYLHSQGLVHRDIKLKNVLLLTIGFIFSHLQLDRQNRAKLTDLGFCKPEAMMSGSIVGTPIHMAPELFTGHYDNSVDVYAFGILFWYICAGHVKLPLVFEQCHSKDQLWQSVRRGSRPERLPSFTDKCWKLMNECWAGKPAERPHLGSVEPRLRKIMLVTSQKIDEENKMESDEGSFSESPKKIDDEIVIEVAKEDVEYINGSIGDHNSNSVTIERGEDALSQCNMSL